MHRSSLAIACLAAAAVGCHSYEPAPVDLQAHLRAFAARLPDVVRHLQGAATGPGEAPFDLHDGIDRREAHLLTVWFAPSCRLARQRAGIAAVARDEAGRWNDPTLSAYARRFLASLQNPWLITTAVGFTLPLSGRLDGERALAAAELDAAVVAARAAEAQAVQRTDAAFARWSADRHRVELLRELSEQVRELEQLARELADAGERTEQEARAFTLERLAREAELAQAEAAAAAGVLQLKRLVGLHPDAEVTFVPDLAPPLRVADAAQRRERLATGPRLAELQRAHTTAERQLELEVARQWPDLTLAPGWENEEAEPALALGSNLPLPLFRGNTPAIRTAEAERSAAAEALRAGLEEALHDLAAAELQLDAARRQQELVTRELLPLSQQQVDDGRRLAALGELQPLLILDALVRAHTARSQAIAADLAVAEATVAVNSLFWNELPAEPGEEPR